MRSCIVIIQIRPSPAWSCNIITNIDTEQQIILECETSTQHGTCKQTASMNALQPYKVLCSNFLHICSLLSCKFNRNYCLYHYILHYTFITYQFINLSRDKHRQFANSIDKLPSTNSIGKLPSTPHIRFFISIYLFCHVTGILIYMFKVCNLLLWYNSPTPLFSSYP